MTDERIAFLINELMITLTDGKFSVGDVEETIERLNDPRWIGMAFDRKDIDTDEFILNFVDVGDKKFYHSEVQSGAWDVSCIMGAYAIDKREPFLITFEESNHIIPMDHPSIISMRDQLRMMTL